jgi:hypothetical protein
MNLARLASPVRSTLLVLAAATAGCSAGSAPGPSSPETRAVTIDQPAPRPRVAEVAAPEGAAAGWHEYRRPLTSRHSLEEPEVSSAYAGWPANRLTDGDPSTTWFSDRNDSAAKGKTPSITLHLFSPGTVKQIVVLGNRDTTWPTGYSVLQGRFQLFNAEGELLRSVDQKATGELHDFEVSLVPPVENVRFVRFTSLADEGNENSYGDIAVSEIWLE